MITDLVEKCARVICETRNVEGFECTCPRPYEPEGNNWCNGNRAIAQALAVIDALADGVSDEMVAEAKFTYMQMQHWPSALSAAIRAAKSREDQ